MMKPISEMDQAEVLAFLAGAEARLGELNNLFGEYQAIVKMKRRAQAELRDRFAIDPKTGRRIRKGGGELFKVG